MSTRVSLPGARREGPALTKIQIQYTVKGRVQGVCYR